MGVGKTDALRETDGQIETAGGRWIERERGREREGE